MLSKTNIDVKIYIDKLIEGINQMGVIEDISNEWGIENPGSFQELLEENLTIQASLNFEDSGDPILNDKQFEEILVRSATECTMEEMAEKGILVKKLEEGGTENVYSINPEVDLDE